MKEKKRTKKQKDKQLADSVQLTSQVSIIDPNPPSLTQKGKPKRPGRKKQQISDVIQEVISEEAILNLTEQAPLHHDSMTPGKKGRMPLNAQPSLTQTPEESKRPSA